jgi:hypothetical protein
METECLKRRRLKGGGHYFSTAIWMKKRDFHRSGQCCTGLFCLAAFVGRVHSLAFCWPVVVLCGACVGRRKIAFEFNEKPTCRPIEFRWTNDGPFSQPANIFHRLAPTFISGKK